MLVNLVSGHLNAAAWRPLQGATDTNTDDFQLFIRIEVIERLDESRTDLDG